MILSTVEVRKKFLGFQAGNKLADARKEVASYMSAFINIVSLKIDFYFEVFKQLRSYPDEGWLFIGRFKVGIVPGMSVALEVSKKVSKSIMSMMQGH